MWTCPKCGEAMENQFDSCRKCSNVPREPAAHAPPRLKLSDYLIAALLAYLIPVAAAIFQSVSLRPYELPFAPALLDSRTWALLLVPGAFNFIVLLPFLKSPGLRRGVAFILFSGWIWLLLSMTVKLH
jgi:hypothetical protein